LKNILNKMKYMFKVHEQCRTKSMYSLNCLKMCKVIIFVNEAHKH